MDESQKQRSSFSQMVLPWCLAAAMLLLYLVTLNHWLTSASLPFTSRVAGWELSPPQQNPLFYTLTYPVRWLPTASQPLALNFLSALFAALTLALLARSVALLPHDRTHEQRLRERSEFSLLSARFAWLPPIFAVLVCGLQLTFWEHATTATNEMLDLLLLAYVIRCLLEARVDPRPAWFDKFAVVYGLGMTNNWAMIGFLPAFLAALLWIRSWAFFNPAFLLRMLALSLAGLLLYLLLPLTWVGLDPAVGFWDILRGQIGSQKGMLFDVPGLRARAVLLALTSLLPILVIGIRWPTSSGDTSPAGVLLTNIMFRTVHLVLLAACIWVAFDQKFSPRSLGLGFPFLSYYYLGALSIGYFVGYVLLVFSEHRTKTWRRPAAGLVILNRVVHAVVWAAAVAVPVLLVYINLPIIRGANGPLLKNFVSLMAQKLPAKGAYVLSDEPYALLLLEGHFAAAGETRKHVMINTRALTYPLYQRLLAKHYSGRWTAQADAAAEEPVEAVLLIRYLEKLAATNEIYYLQPSFGYYFERFYAVPRGLVQQLRPYPPNTLYPPLASPEVVEENRVFWKAAEELAQQSQNLQALGITDAAFASASFSRSLNDWAVHLQKLGQAGEGLQLLERAVQANTNNIAAKLNLDFHRFIQTGSARTEALGKNAEEKLGVRSWDRTLGDNGPFDEPNTCLLLGQLFTDQNLIRQASLSFNRAAQLEPENLEPQLALGSVFLLGNRPQETHDLVRRIRANQENKSLSLTNKIDLVRLEAGAFVKQTNFDAAERVLLEAHQAYPKDPFILDQLLQTFMASNRLTNALDLTTAQLEKNPRDVPMLFRKVDVLFNMQRWDDALATLEEILAVDPTSVQARVYQASVYLQKKDSAKGIAKLNEALQRAPEDVDALLSLGAAQMEAKQYEEAIETLDSLIKIAPNHWAAVKNRAIAHLQLGHLDDAEEDFELLRRLVPRYHAAYFGLGEIAYQRKHRKDAIKFYQLYLRFAPQSKSADMIAEREKVTARLKELNASS